MCGQIPYRESLLFYNVEAPARCHSTLAPHAAQLARKGEPQEEKIGLNVLALRTAYHWSIYMLFRDKENSTRKLQNKVRY